MRDEEKKSFWERESPDEHWSIPLQALWWDAKGNWDRAHRLVQNEETQEAARVHAYLHRKEGDEWNAGYWYRRSGESFFRGSLEEEWEFLVKRLK